MGQKINPNIFRLGVNKTWKTKFFEKKSQELPLYTFKDLEIKSYIERFLETQGIILHDYKQYYSNSTLNLYLSYFVTSEFTLKKNDLHNLTLVNRLGDKKLIQNTQIDKTVIPKVNITFKKLNKSSSNFYSIKKYLKLNYYNDLQKLGAFKAYASNNKSLKQSSSSFSNVTTKSVFEQLFKVLSLFTNKKFNIIINFCCINKDLNFLKFSQTKKFILLQKFRNTLFLKEGIELLFHAVYNRNSANLLAKFIAFQIRKIKRHKFFLSFLKQTLTILIDSSFSKVKGIKIIVKGRLNGVPRAKHKIITIGDIPVQSINEILDYSQTTVHNSNGSYAIKVWIVEKELKNIS